jgi:hypothetical protein
MHDAYRRAATADRGVARAIPRSMERDPSTMGVDDSNSSGGLEIDTPDEKRQ